MSAAEIPSNALVVLVRPSGCGKHLRAAPLPTDRGRVFRRVPPAGADDETDQSATPQAFAVFHAIVRGPLSLGRLTVADATNLDPAVRARLRDEAARHGAPVVALALDVPLETCRAQNLGRPRRVPPEVIELHYRRYEETRALLPSEGYHALYVVGPDTEVSLVAPVLPPPEPPPKPALPRMGMLRSRTRPAPGA